VRRVVTSVLNVLGVDFVVPGMPRYIWCLLCSIFIQLMSLGVCSVERMDGAVCMQTCKKNSGSQDSLPCTPSRSLIVRLWRSSKEERNADPANRI